MTTDKLIRKLWALEQKTDGNDSLKKEIEGYLEQQLGCSNSSAIREIMTFNFFCLRRRYETLEATIRYLEEHRPILFDMLVQAMSKFSYVKV